MPANPEKLPNEMPGKDAFPRSTVILSAAKNLGSTHLHSPVARDHVARKDTELPNEMPANTKTAERNPPHVP